MRISIYSFNDLMRSYVILQFENGEVGVLNNVMRGYSVKDLRRVIEEALSAKVKSLSLAYGTMLYEDSEMSLTYMRIELDNNDQYTLEIYDESAYVITNVDIKTTYEVLTKLISKLAPMVKVRRSSSLLTLIGEGVKFME
ncbi:MAG TPA: hypothetical protein ENG05_02900 [Acidilobales archaeon]|nr:hypothetical protein [Acidilobales archaeon]